MFLEIKPHEGVWVDDGNGTNSIYKWENCRLNLNFVKAIYFDKIEMFERDGEIFKFIKGNDYEKSRYRKINSDFITSEDEGMKAITANVITFMNFNNDLLNFLELWILYFSKEGEGEFQRIRRIIDEHTFK